MIRFQEPELPWGLGVALLAWLLCAAAAVQLVHG
jgi:hypothetical protein